MTAAITSHPRNHPANPVSTAHLFEIGQAVRLKGGFGAFLKTSDAYRVTGTLPPMGEVPQYRIRNDDERYERVATQDNLEPVRTPLAGGRSTLIERTFGHGQGTETRQPRNQKAETEKESAQT